MSEELVVRLCAPTLAGLKTGSLFSTEYTSEAALTQEVDRLNAILIPKGLRALTLRFGRCRALIYVYRRNRLERDLAQAETRALLEPLGYRESQTDACLAQLKSRLAESPEFPHEIGLFLSYPPEDVRGFMENRAAGYKCVGCWKVYGDVERATRIFRQYKHCTEIYCSKLRSGMSIDRLTVAG